MSAAVCNLCMHSETVTYLASKMSKITFILRPANASGLRPVSVRHTHNGSAIERGTNVTVHPDYFDVKTGKLRKLPSAPEDNAKIQAVATQLETAARNLKDPTKPAMIAELARLEALAELRKETVPQATRILSRIIDVLNAELADLERQVLLKKAEINQEELRQGRNTAALVHETIAAYATSIAKTRSANTVVGYEYCASQVKAFNPIWVMKDVNEDTLEAFVTHLIDSGYRNLTINDIITKLKTVMYAKGKKLELDIQSIKDFKTGVNRKRNPNVIFLTKNELRDLSNLELDKEHEQRIRDRFVFMAMTGVRFSDSSIKPANVQGGKLVLSTEKTDTDLIIPISPTVQEILTRYNNTFPRYDLASYNRTLKDICSRVESLNYEITVKTYKGKNKPKKTTPLKWEKISAHIARKTFINHALGDGINPVAIADIVGHTDTDLIMRVYGSKDSGRERIGQMAL